LWSAASAGNHFLNAALHAHGVSEEDDVYPTQVAGVYLSADARRLLKRPGDVLHLGMPPLDGALPPELDSACEALALIEDVASRCIRAGEPPEPGLVNRCARAYADLVAAFEQALASHGGQP
jgi:hypothetical protein